MFEAIQKQLKQFQDKNPMKKTVVDFAQKMFKSSKTLKNVCPNEKQQFLMERLIYFNNNFCKPFFDYSIIQSTIIETNNWQKKFKQIMDQTLDIKIRSMAEANGMRNVQEGMAKILIKEKPKDVQKKEINNILSQFFANTSLEHQFCKDIIKNVQSNLKTSNIAKIMESSWKEVNFIIKKQREYINDEQIAQDYRQQRKEFYCVQAKIKLNQAGVPQKEQDQIVKLIEKQSKITLDNLGPLRKYMKLIKELINSICSINELFSKKKIGCLPMQQIINRKLTTLKVIQIQYHFQINQYGYQQYYYSISAFELFKVIHANKTLSQVIIKGVRVQQFQQFTYLLNRIKHNLPFQVQQKYNNDINWISKFNPSKYLNIAINSKISFDIQNKIDSHSKRKDLIFFNSFFNYLSDITILMKVKDSDGIKQLKKQFEQFWKFLKQIKKIKIQIYNTSTKTSDSSQYVLQQLSQFTDIAQLSLIKINFKNDFMKQYLSTICKNNLITKLEINACDNFPILPQIVTLQSLKLDIQERFPFMGPTKNNKLLKYVRCQKIEKEWEIDNNLLNQLQTLVLQKCDGLSFHKISSIQPSFIKYLSISHCQNIVGYLPNIFPKLVHITYLQLKQIKFQCSLLIDISSTNLQQLHLYSSNIEDKELIAVDSKWPNISNITLSQCNKITESVWNLCDFKELKRLNINQKMFGDKVLYHIKSRGIKVSII